MSQRNLILSIGAVVVVAAAAIIAIVSLSRGNSTSGAAASSPAAAPSPATTSASAPTASASGSGVTCADISGTSLLKGKLTLHAGGTVPSGAPLPSTPPALVCSGETHVNETAHVTALVWPNVALADYLGQLKHAGWRDNTTTPPFHVLDKQGAKYEIVALTVSGSSVAIFGHS